MNKIIFVIIFIINIMTIDFSDLSKSITKKLSQKEKKDNGIFFTPNSIIETNLNLLEKYKFKNVLEPSCGSCQFINYLDNNFDNLNVTGVELNKTIYDEIKDLEFKNKVKIVNQNFLTFSSKKKYDLIIGNPPFNVVKKEKKYENFVDGRPNIFMYFIIESLKLLSDNGILSFILPTNFLNSLYYNKLRTFIDKNCKIIDIVNCKDDDYLETAQETVIFIVQNKKSSNDKYKLEKGNLLIFNTKDNIKKIKKLYENSKSLDELDCTINVGTVVWNQHKDILTDDNKKTRLIYSGDIKDNKLILTNYKDPQKKNFIDKEGNSETILVLNRGYGKGEYVFNYCLIEHKNYLIENHLICIKSKDKSVYKKIIESFNNKKTGKFVKLYFGNNAINTTELKYILPIY